MLTNMETIRASAATQRQKRSDSDASMAYSSAAASGQNQCPRPDASETTSSDDMASLILRGEDWHRWLEIILWMILAISCFATLYCWDR